jgi:hypothetical protein
MIDYPFLWPTSTFVTINLADTYNPITHVLGGCNIDLDKFFDQVSGMSEPFEHAKCPAETPVAGAKSFNILIGCK